MATGLVLVRARVRARGVGRGEGWKILRGGDRVSGGVRNRGGLGQGG